MTAGPTTPSGAIPVVPYATPTADQILPLMRPMWQWRAACGHCAWVTVVGGIFWFPLGVVAFAAAVSTGAMTLLYMGKAARAEAGMEYAARQVLLAVLLMPVMFLGVWLVPALVQSDLLKWRRVDHPDRPRTPADSADGLASAAGRWVGRNLLWLSPDAPPDESDSTLVVTPILGGLFVRLDQAWAYQGRPQSGSLLVGRVGDGATVHWVDTFHNGPRVMACAGTVGADGTLDVRGTYPVPDGPPWGWRIEIAVSSARVEMRMFNVPPDAPELPAVLATYSI